jgi:hypothetical protein
VGGCCAEMLVWAGCWRGSVGSTRGGVELWMLMLMLMLMLIEGYGMREGRGGGRSRRRVGAEWVTGYIGRRCMYVCMYLYYGYVGLDM